MSSDTKREMVERLIIENHDPTTNEPYDVKGIADDVIDLIASEQRQLIDRIIEGLPEPDRWRIGEGKSYMEVDGFNYCLELVTALLNKIRGEL